MFFCPFLWLETHKWNKTPSLRLGSPQPASSTGLKTMGSNLHHLTKKRHQNLKTISCLRLLKIRLLRHSCRTVNLMMRPHGILKNQLQPNAVKDANRFHRPPISFSITRIYSQPGDPQTNSSSTKDFVAALGTELHGTMELKKERNKNAGNNLQCKIGFRKTRQFFCPLLLSKLLSGQSAKFLWLR